MFYPDNSALKELKAIRLTPDKNGNYEEVPFKPAKPYTGAKKLAEMTTHVAEAAHCNPQNQKVHRWWGNLQAFNMVYKNNTTKEQKEFILEKAEFIYNEFLQIEEELYG